MSAFPKSSAADSTPGPAPAFQKTNATVSDKKSFAHSVVAPSDTLPSVPSNRSESQNDGLAKILGLLNNFDWAKLAAAAQEIISAVFNANTAGEIETAVVCRLPEIITIFKS